MGGCKFTDKKNTIIAAVEQIRRFLNGTHILDNTNFLPHRTDLELAGQNK